jgi:hypothetical protein
MVAYRKGTLSPKYPLPSPLPGVRIGRRNDALLRGGAILQISDYKLLPGGVQKAPSPKLRGLLWRSERSNRFSLDYTRHRYVGKCGITTV